MKVVYVEGPTGWAAYAADRYDGDPSTPIEGRFVGYGKTQDEAGRDLLERIAETFEEKPARVSWLSYLSPPVAVEVALVTLIGATEACAQRGMLLEDGSVVGMDGGALVFPAPESGIEVAAFMLYLLNKKGSRKKKSFPFYGLLTRAVTIGEDLTPRFEVGAMKISLMGY